MFDFGTDAAKQVVAKVEVAGLKGPREDDPESICVASAWRANHDKIPAVENVRLLYSDSCRGLFRVRSRNAIETASRSPQHPRRLHP